MQGFRRTSFRSLAGYSVKNQLPLSRRKEPPLRLLGSATTPSSRLFAEERTKSHSLSSFESLARSAIARAPSGFSSTRPFSSSASDLAEILERELAEEVEGGDDGMPAELATLKQNLQEQQAWKIVDDGAVTKMYRTLADTGSKVQLTFHCQDTVEVLDGGGDVVDEGLGDEIEEEAGPVRFTVTVAKAGRTLVFTCLSEDAAARIQSVATTATADDVDSKSFGVDGYQYQGPEFSELAEDLQDAFHAFLEDDVSVNEDVASFVSMYSDYREQVEYVKFLEDAKSVLRK